MRKCNKCLEIKTLEYFSRVRSLPLGRSYQCKACMNAYHLGRAAPRNAARRARRAINPEHYRAQRKEWLAARPGYAREKAMQRHAAKLQRCPKWLTGAQRQQIRAFYTVAAELTKASDVAHDVDHILPLQGETVSGLHVPWNLQILTASENYSKGNRLIP